MERIFTRSSMTLLAGLITLGGVGNDLLVSIVSLRSMDYRSTNLEEVRKQASILEQKELGFENMREIKRKYNTKPNLTSFKKGHVPLAGAFGKGDKMPESAKRLISQSLRGKTGISARRWLGKDAGYVAKHMWIAKHFGKANKCEFNSTHTSTRYHWANISGKYLRDRSDYKMSCPSCNVKMSKINFCKNGHEFTKKNTYIRPEGWRVCRICQKERSLRYAKTVAL